jgi:hypothetical protein
MDWPDDDIGCIAGVEGGSMADTKTIIEQAYSTFNTRDIDGALALMAQDVSWPKASEGGKDYRKRRDPCLLDSTMG